MSGASTGAPLLKGAGGGMCIRLPQSKELNPLPRLQRADRGRVGRSRGQGEERGDAARVVDKAVCGQVLAANRPCAHGATQGTDL